MRAKTVKARQKHVVIAMNPLMGLSLARHKKLPLAATTIVCSPAEASERLRGLDIHDLAIHVAGDTLNIPLDIEVFNAVLGTCTNH